MTSKGGNVSIEMKCGPKISGTTHVFTKKLFDLDFCWKVLVTLAILGLVIYVVLHSLTGHDMVERASIVAPTVQTRNIKEAIKKPPPKSGNRKCTENSITGSYASFMFIPRTELYKTNGVEFSFENLVKAANLGYRVKPLNNSLIKTSHVHYYYNIDRCRIGGGIDLTTKPHIRGALIFAINQECDAVYYYSDRYTEWIEYKSSRSVTCTNHGFQYCSTGTIHKNKWTFSIEHNVTALEFTFETLSQKLEKQNKILTHFGNKDFHYLLDMKSCLTEGLKDPRVFAVDENCTTVHMLDHNVISWIPQKGINLSCPWTHGVSWCERNTLLNSTASYSFVSTDKMVVTVNGVKISFKNLVSKLHGLLFNKEDIPESQMQGNAQDVSYYLNMKRCVNGGVLESPHIRGPLIFAVSGNCTKVHYYSTLSQMWIPYRTASNIACN